MLFLSVIEAVSEEKGEARERERERERGTCFLKRAIQLKRMPCTKHMYRRFGRPFLRESDPLLISGASSI